MAKEFEALKQTVEANVKARQEQHGTDSPAGLHFESNSENEFLAGGRETSAVFSIEDNRIYVRNRCPSEHRSRKKGELQFVLDLTLNEDGECRFKVEGEEGEFLRWQVAREALEDILF